MNINMDQRYVQLNGRHAETTFLVRHPWMTVVMGIIVWGLAVGIINYVA